MLRRRFLQFIAEVRPGPKMLLVVCLSFCAGLLVFYMPERNYAGVPTIWLPSADSLAQNNAGSLPVRVDPQWQYGVKFMPYSPGEIELVELKAENSGFDAAACPDLYNVSEQEATPCGIIGTVADSPVYGIQRQKDSYNIQAYMVRGGTLIAITGVYSHDEALGYLRQLTEVPHRQVSRHLSGNNTFAGKSVTALQEQELQQRILESTAYQRLPFSPLLPATLPAGWVQYSTRMGTDAAQPSSVDILYKKGDRLIGMQLRQRAGFSLGKKCGPTPGLAKLVSCRKDTDKVYYSGGVNKSDRTSLYLYRPLGNTVAIVMVSIRPDDGDLMVFDEDTLRAQISIIESLRVVDAERLRGAGFAGGADVPQ